MNARTSRIVAIIQARMASRRCPAKVLRPIAGRPMLGFLLDRVRRMPVNGICVATSTAEEDNAIEEFCLKESINVFRGSLTNVSSRLRDAARTANADAVLRICADSPLLDLSLCAHAVQLFLRGTAEIVTNTHPRSFPKGQSVEIISRSALEAVDWDAASPEEREHVTRFFYLRPSEWRIENFQTDQDSSAVQLSVDTLDDFHRVSALFLGMSKPHWTYGWEDLASELRRVTV